MPHAPLALSVPLAAVLLLLAVPAAITARRGWAGRLDRQGRLGLHTPAAQAGDEAFALANRVAAPIIGGAAAVGLVCAALVLVLPLGVVGAIVIGVLGVAGVLGQFAAASVMGERAARTVPRPARKSEAAGGCCGACGCGGGGCAGGAAGGSGAGAAADRRPASHPIPDLLPDPAGRGNR